MATIETIDPGTQDRLDMERLASGDDGALDHLMDRHATRIFHFIYRMLGNEEDANDLAQETFVRVYRNAASFRTGEDFSKWLYTIAANLARNHIRWRTRHPNVSLDGVASESESQNIGERLSSEDKNPEQQLSRQERQEAVRRAVAELPEDMRESLVLCEWEECTVAEAAAILNTTPKAVESRLYRARQRLRQQLKEWLKQ